MAAQWPDPVVLVVDRYKDNVGPLGRVSILRPDGPTENTCGKRRADIAKKGSSIHRLLLVR
jgi:hypothetical protein